jgi:type VI secretion system protein ImpH
MSQMSSLVSPLQVHSASVLTETFWQKLAQCPYRYDLFQLLRRIDAQGGERFMLGRAPLPRHEPLRLGQEPSLAFAPSTLAQVTAQPQGGHLVKIYSFGLFGPNGPLPLHLTEYVRERLYHHQDPSLSAFADLFHHRLTLLFYRAWADAQPTVSLDRADNQRFVDYLACLIGMGLPGQLAGSSLSSHARLSYAGHLTRHGHDVEGLEKILRHYFAVDVHIQQNVAQWLPVDRREQARLRAGRGMPRLGENTFLGIAMRDVQHKIIIQLGPLDWVSYNRFLPGGELAQRLRDWVRQYLGNEFVWEVQLLLAAEPQSVTRLGGAQRLGLSSWLGESAAQHAHDSLCYSPEPLERIVA